MKSIPKIFFSGFLLGVISSSYCKGQSIDTVKIYRNKSAIGYSGYWKEWFTPKRFLYKTNFSYSYSLGSRFTHQDSIIMAPPHTMYYKVYDRLNLLMMEGETTGDGAELTGDIKYFYKSGKLKRLEKWGEGIMRDSCEHELIKMHDAPGPEGNWTYYRRNGSIYKTVTYLILPRQHINKQSCYWVAQITSYSRKGRKRKITEKELREI
jgi:hypothetical protein